MVTFQNKDNVKRSFGFFQLKRSMQVPANHAVKKALSKLPRKTIYVSNKFWKQHDFGQSLFINSDITKLSYEDLLRYKQNWESGKRIMKLLKLGKCSEKEKLNNLPCAGKAIVKFYENLPQDIRNNLLEVGKVFKDIILNQDINLQFKFERTFEELEN